MKNLLLFDIDGTLLSRADGHADAFAVALHQVHNVYGSMYMINHHGMTDQQIIREVLQKCGVPDGEIDSKMGACIDAMCRYYDSIKSYMKANPLPGVSEVISQLDTEDNLLGLVTGNLESIAHAKLGNAGIDQHFKLGGFGSDAPERSDLVKLAIRHSAEKFGFGNLDRVYLFGDAPQDMRAAVAGGAKAIGVTTGIYNRQQLVEAGANWVIDGIGVVDFEELEKIIA